MKTFGICVLIAAALFNLPFVVHIIRHIKRPQLDWPVWVYHLRRKLRL